MQNENLPVNTSRPNLLRICVDAVHGHELSGRVYHCYSAAAMPFGDLWEMIRLCDAFFEQIGFPQQSTAYRSFFRPRRGAAAPAVPPRVLTAEQLAQNRGSVATYFLEVETRSGATWQGRLYWQEQNRSYPFESVLEMGRLMDETAGALSADDAPPDGTPQ